MNMEVEFKTEEEKKATNVNEKSQKENGEEERWQTKIKSLKCAISHIYQTKEFSDVEFTIGSKIFKAHRLILGARSPVFARILLKSNAPSKIICDEDVSEVGFDILLKFIYTEELEATNHEEILEAHQAALRFEQKELLKECEILIGEWELACSNVCTILNKAAGILFVKEKCLKYIKNNIKDVIASENFLNATTDSIREMLQNDCFEDVPIMTVIHSVLQWSDKQLLQPEDCTTVRDYLMLTGILGRLKIHKLSTEELIQFTAEYQNILTPIELQQFTVYNLPASGEKTLPEWCIT